MDPVHESVALLRGAMAREPQETCYDATLDAVLAGDRVDAGHTAEIDLGMVDAWIRRGMLVEALALLGGTTLGTTETGQEWANLLGELLAPVPVDAEETLVQMHRQLLSGGAAVALTLLEDRAKNLPGLPAWALRRRDVLRWLLLDNAKTAESDPVPAGDAPTELARVIEQPLSRRNLRGAAKAVQAYAEMHPESEETRRVAEALSSLVAEMETQAAKAQEQMRTIPMYGPPAAAMQLRMGNLQVAAAVYRRLIDENPDDARLQVLLGDVDTVIAAIEGRPIETDELLGENTLQVPVRDSEPDAANHQPESLPAVPDEAVPDEAVPDEAVPDEAVPDEVVQDLEIPNTSVTRAPMEDPGATGRQTPERSGMMTVRGDEVHEGPTLQTPSVDTSASELEEAGRYAEAEALYRALAETDPSNTEWLRRAERCRLRQLGYGDEDADVLVRVIVPVQ